MEFMYSKQCCHLLLVSFFFLRELIKLWFVLSVFEKQTVEAHFLSFSKKQTKKIFFFYLKSNEKDRCWKYFKVGQGPVYIYIKTNINH